MPTSTTVSTTTVAANGTTLRVERRGAGDPLLLVHGGGEDAAMLAGQAADLAGVGYEVVTYDRRGTGGSGREHWPGDGADQHADDAAALIAELGWDDPTVVGVSSGGVIALDLVARHPDAVGPVVAWEPPAAGAIPGGAEASAAIMAPVDAHLAVHPGDFVGAQAVLLSAVIGAPVAVDDPAFAAARANAEPFIRDEPTIASSALDAAALGGCRRHDRRRVGAQRPGRGRRRRAGRMDRPPAGAGRRRPRGLPGRPGRADRDRHLGTALTIQHSDGRSDRLLLC